MQIIGVSSPFRINVFLLVLSVCMLASCRSVKSVQTDTHKYSVSQLQEDFNFYRKNLEVVHPGLYWYTPKPMMDAYFDQGFRSLQDSMTEREFRIKLMYITSKVNCGHTIISRSKAASKAFDESKVNFPFNIKLMGDTMAIVGHRTLKDTVLQKGQVVKSINGWTSQALSDTLFQFISSDGYNTSYKAQTLSANGNFDHFYTYIFGVPDTFKVVYTDSTGRDVIYLYPTKKPDSDSLKTDSIAKNSKKKSDPKKITKRERLNSVRNLKVDKHSSVAVLSVQSFSSGYRLRRFFKKSFKQIHHDSIRHLIVDIRGNLGGNPLNSAALSKYLAKSPFILADSLYANTIEIYSTSFIQRFIHKSLMIGNTKKNLKGERHFRYFERKTFKPRKKLFYDQSVYVLTGPLSFSASTLFLNTVKGQDNIKLVGEETGGGAYGNTAFIIPVIKLPHTGLRLRLPTCRFVDDIDIPHDGHGVLPDVYLKTDLDAIREGRDYRMEWAKKMIVTEP